MLKAIKSKTAFYGQSRHGRRASRRIYYGGSGWRGSGSKASTIRRTLGSGNRERTARMQHDADEHELLAWSRKSQTSNSPSQGIEPMGSISHRDIHVMREIEVTQDLQRCDMSYEYPGTNTPRSV